MAAVGRGCRLLARVAPQCRQLQARAFQYRGLALGSSCQATIAQRPTTMRRLPFVRHMTTNDFHKYADETLETLTNELEELVEKHPEGLDFDISLANGVLTVDLASRGTFVINKQTPNKQIWLSSPLSGPKRYDFDETLFDWVYSHDAVALHTRLSNEFSELFGLEVELIKPSKDWFD